MLQDEGESFGNVLLTCINCLLYRLLVVPQGSNSRTRQLLDNLLARRKIYVIAAKYREKLFIRFVVCSRLCETSDMELAWKEISEQATEVLRVEDDKTETTEVEGGKETANIATMIEELNIDRDFQGITPKIS